MDGHPTVSNESGNTPIVQLLLAGAYFRALQIETALAIYASLAGTISAEAFPVFDRLAALVGERTSGVEWMARLGAALQAYCQDTAHRQVCFAVINELESAFAGMLQRHSEQQELLPVLSILIDNQARQASLKGWDEQADVWHSLRQHIARNIS